MCKLITFETFVAIHGIIYLFLFIFLLKIKELYLGIKTLKYHQNLEKYFQFKRF